MIAARLDGEVRLAELAASTGFFDQSHLSRVFSRQVGVPPASWRKGRPFR